MNIDPASNVVIASIAKVRESTTEADLRREEEEINEESDDNQE